MVNTYSRFSTKKTPQSEAIPGSDQVENSAGGYAYSIGIWKQLDRFLILGTEGGTYYTGSQELTRENAENVIACIKEDGVRAVNTIVLISKDGRAPKNDPAIFALALAISVGDVATRRKASASITQVCRTGTHIMHFAKYAEQFRGWGRVLKDGVGQWFTSKDAEKLAYQAVKYQARDGWSLKDLLILSHPKPILPGQADVFDWIMGREDNEALTIPVIQGQTYAHQATSNVEVADVVREYGLPHEALPTEYKWTKEVATALTEQGMPIGALVRNLGNLTKAGVLDNLEIRGQVIETLHNETAISKSRIHPIQVLSAMLTYGTGQGFRGKNTWEPVPQIVDALDDAFYLAFGNVEKTDKRVMVALDVSGSMGFLDIAGVPGLTPRTGSAAMALVTMKASPNYDVIAFTGGGRYRYGAGSQGADDVTSLSLSPRMRLDTVVKEISELPFGGTDCALPMIHALKKGKKIDTFVIYTDNETWAGSIHPSQALKEYRAKSGIDARLVVVGMTSTDFSIADPNDAGMLDVVGFDTATPQLITDFSAGKF